MQELSTLPEYYSLIRAKELKLDDELSLELDSFGTNTSGNYNIMHKDAKVGQVSLAYHPRSKTCSFDINVTTPGTGVGTKTLRILAVKLSGYGYSFITSGVMPESTEYWKKLEDKGLVEEVDGEEKQYKVLA